MRGALLATAMLLLGACEAPEGELSEPLEPAVEVERSPEETEPFEPAPSVEVTGGPVAALHQQGMREADPAVAVERFESACDRGFTPSCLALAERLESGEGVEPDPERAAQLIEEACMSGSTLACDRMGH